MARPKKQRIPLELSHELELDLRAFCEVFFDANRSEVIRRAIAEFISKQVDDASKRKEFELTRRRLNGEPIKLVSRPDNPRVSSAGEE